MMRYNKSTNKQIKQQKETAMKWMTMISTVFAIIFVLDNATVNAQQTCTDPATGRPVPCPPEEDEEPETSEEPENTTAYEPTFQGGVRFVAASKARFNFLLGYLDTTESTVEDQIKNGEWQDAVRYVQGLIGAISPAVFEAQFVVDFMPTLRDLLANDEDPNVVEQRKDFEEILDRLEQAFVETHNMLSSCEAKAFELLNELQLQDAEAAQQLLEALLRRCSLGEAWLDQATKNVDSANAKILESATNGNGEPSEPAEFDFAEFVAKNEQDSRALGVRGTIGNLGSNSDDAPVTYEELRENLRKLNFDSATDAFRFIESRAKYWRARYKFRVAVARALLPDQPSPELGIFISSLESTAAAFEVCGNEIQTRGLDTQLVVSNIGDSGEGIVDEIEETCQAGPNWLAWAIDQAKEFDRRSQLPEDERHPFEIKASCGEARLAANTEDITIEIDSEGLTNFDRVIVVIAENPSIDYEPRDNGGSDSSDVQISIPGYDDVTIYGAQIRIEFIDDAGNIIFVDYAQVEGC
jgi:hypothetical protein